MAGPAGPRFQLRRGCGGARSRPWAKKPINAHTGSATPNRFRYRTAAPASRFNACPSALRCGAGRTSNSRSIAAARSTARRYSHCACGSRTPRNHRRTVDSGRPNRAAIERYPAPRGLRDQGVPDRLGAVRAAHGQRGREQDLGDRAVSAAGPPRGHGHGVGPDAADGAGPAVAERAQHTPAPRARQVARQQGLLGHVGAHHHHHNRGLHSCQPALPTTADVGRGHFVLQEANSHRAPSRSCRPGQRSARRPVFSDPATARRRRFPSSSS